MAAMRSAAAKTFPRHQDGQTQANFDGERRDRNNASMILP